MPENTVQIFNPPNHESGAPYSHISTIPLTATTKLVIFAGQIGRDPVTRDIPNTLVDQVGLALKNVDVCLEAVGAKRTDIVQVRQYVVDLHPLDKGRVELYREWMGGHSPPSTVIGVQSLADQKMLYEIEVTAVVSTLSP